VRQVPVSDLVPEQVLPWQSHFVGAILQRPPMVSALRQGGKRLYELAREGETVEVPEREVLVDRLEVLGWRTEPHWELDVEIHCAGGTYIRSIARDWGAKLGCGGTLAALRRTMNSGFYVKDAVLLDHVTKDTELLPLHVPLLVAGNCYPAVRVSAAGAKKWLQGQALATDEFVDVPSPCGKPRNDLYLVFDENNHLLGAGRYCGGIIPSMVLTNCGDG
jgi:tRNA pseudouridine55 synthase